MENKQRILAFLLAAINNTAAGEDVIDLRYDPEKETVHVDFESGADGRIINIACDSGWAMIKDVVNQIFKE